MMFFRSLRYLLVFIVPAVVAIGFLFEGTFWSWFPVLFVFGFLPLIEWALGTSVDKIAEHEEAQALRSPWFRVMMFAAILTHFSFLGWFILDVAAQPWALSEFIGKSVSMGLMSGVLGINIAHEMGHHPRKLDQWVAKALLMTSCYVHFFIEHNKGHHRNVGTPADPATARMGESVYGFWLRVIPGAWKSAFQITEKELQRKKEKVWSWNNEFLRDQCIQALFILSIVVLAGWKVLLAFFIASIIGVLLLETVNYVEHYGLMRTKVSEHRYEDVEPHHSWNSDYMLGRLVLFELTRHSDHHWQPQKEYELLRPMEGAGQLPLGYPAMMVMAMLPPVWFAVMNERAEKVSGESGQVAH